MSTGLTTQFDDFFSKFTSVKYKKGERIVRENDTPSGVFMAKSGIIRTYLISEEGNELTLLLQDKNSIFPLRWAINNLPNIYNYQALTDVELFRAPRDLFYKYLEENPHLLMDITKKSIWEFSALTYRMQHIVFGNAYAKGASIILTAAKRFGSENTNNTINIEIPLTHQQIADSVGVTRETASLEMKKLKDDGLITYKGRIIVVLDVKKLAKASYL